MNKQNQIPTPQGQKNAEPLFELGPISGSTRVDCDDEWLKWHYHNHVRGHFGWVTDATVSSNWDSIKYLDGTVVSVFPTDEHDVLVITTEFYRETRHFDDLTISHVRFLEEMCDEPSFYYRRCIDRNRFFINEIAPAIH